MAGCSSNFGVLRVVNLSKEAVSRKLRNQNLSSNSLSFRNVLKDASFPIFCGNKCCRYVSLQKKERIVKMNMSQPLDESHFGVTTTEVSEGEGEGLKNNHKIWDNGSDSKTDSYDNSGVIDDGNVGNGSFGSGGAGGGGGSGGGGDDGGDEEEEEFGPILKYDEVMSETNARGATLPPDMLEAAKSVGIREVLLRRYLDLQVQCHKCPCIYFPFLILSCLILNELLTQTLV